MTRKGKGRIGTACRLLALLSIAGWTAQAEGGGYSCGGGYYAPPTYYSTYTPVYEAPVQYVTKYVDRDVLYPYPVKAYINPDYYFSTQDYYRDKLLVDAVAGRTVQLLQGGPAASYQGYTGFQVQAGQQVLTPQQIAAILAQLQQGAQPPAAAPPAAAPPPPVSPPPVMPPAAGGGGPQRDWRDCWYGGPGDAADPALAKAVNDNCLTCHGGTNPARIDLRDLGRISFVGRSLVKGLVDDGTMPKNAHPLDNPTAALFQAWFQAGYKQAVAHK